MFWRLINYSCSQFCSLVFQNPTRPVLTVGLLLPWFYSIWTFLMSTCPRVSATSCEVSGRTSWCWWLTGGCLRPSAPLGLLADHKQQVKLTSLIKAAINGVVAARRSSSDCSRCFYWTGQHGASVSSQVSGHLVWSEGFIRAGANESFWINMKHLCWTASVLWSVWYNHLLLSLQFHESVILLHPFTLKTLTVV